MKKRKLAIVMRTDLDMGAGKMVVMGSHAAVKATLSFCDPEWLNSGQKTICVGVDNLEHLYAIMKKAEDHQVNCQLIKDAGLTQNPEGTVVCLAVGPDKDKRIEKVTGSLKLLP